MLIDVDIPRPLKASAKIGFIFYYTKRESKENHKEGRIN